MMTWYQKMILVLAVTIILSVTMIICTHIFSNAIVEASLCIRNALIAD